MDTLFPPIIVAYLEGFAPLFRANNFLYFQSFILAFMLLGKTRKCVTNIADVCFFMNKHISSIERFLSQYKWDIRAVTSKLISLIKDKMGAKLLVNGAFLAWIDTTLVPKIKGKIPGVQKWHDHSGNSDRGGYITGHHWAIVGLLSSIMVGQELVTLCLPLLTNLVSGQKNVLGFIVEPNGICQAMTFWDTACPLVAQIHQEIGQYPMRVVADAYFSKAPFINYMLCIDVNVLTRMRKDAVGWDDPIIELDSETASGNKRRGRKRKHPEKGKEWKIANLINCLPIETVSVFIYGKIQSLDIVTRDVWIRDVLSQKIRVVVIKNRKEPIILLSTDTALSPVEIIEMYALRFPLELSIRDLKQHFGFGNYQFTNLLSITRFAGLSLVSFCLWRLALIFDIESDWLKDNKQTSTLSFTKISRGVRRFVVQKVFQKFASNADLDKSTPIPEEVIRLVA